MTATTHYDAIVIGAGQAGGPLSTALAQAGWRTAIIERIHVGGTCINEGCTPTKTMVASARVAYLARRAADYGVRTGPVTVDMTVVRKRKRDIVDIFRNGSQKRIESTEGVDLLMGEAHFTGPKVLEVRLSNGETRQLTANAFFINAGDRPSRPEIAGLDSVPTLDSTSIMELDSVPDHLLVLGGGYIGMEFGQMFRRYGSRVTVLHTGKQIISREDPETAAELQRALEAEGIQFLLDTRASRVENKNGALALSFESPAGASTISGSHLLLATGRRPNTDDLGLDKASIATDESGYIKVNGRLET